MMPPFVPAEGLDYHKNRYPFAAGDALTLDVAYRANQLPLLRPDDPRVIARLAGSDAHMGRYAASRFSVAALFDWELFDESAAFRQMVRALRDSAISGKIDWAMFERRRKLLHATICARVERSMSPDEAVNRLDALQAIGPFAVRVTGLWVGNQFNRGRFYLPLYPELRGNDNTIHAVQRRFGAPITNFYAIGLINIVADLDVEETTALERLVRAFGDRTLSETVVTQMSLIQTNDDLVLSGRVLHSVAL